MTETFCDAHTEVAVAHFVRVAEGHFVLDDDVSHLVHYLYECGGVDGLADDGFAFHFVHRRLLSRLCSFLFRLGGGSRRVLRGSVAESLCYGVHRFHRRFRLRVHRAAPTECGSGHGAVEQSFELRVEFEHGDRRARHVDRRHEVAHQRLVDGNARLFKLVGYGVVQHVKFHERSGAEAVDEHRHFVALFAADVLKQVFNDTFCKFICRLQLFRLSARLAVNAHAELYLVVADVENGSAFRRGSAASERKAEGANIVDDLVGYSFDFFE